jgi:NADH-quinone oxidoreductase subunit J
MSFGDWISTSENVVFLVIAAAMAYSALRVVTSRNVVHAVLFLVGTLAASAALFLLLAAEFVAWTVVLVYIGAVIVLFLFGIMITRAPLGVETKLSHGPSTQIPAALVSGGLFVLLVVLFGRAFADTEIVGSGALITTANDIGFSIFSDYVVPFEVVSVVLLAALIGGIVLARRDPEDSNLVEERLQ